MHRRAPLLGLSLALAAGCSLPTPTHAGGHGAPTSAPALVAASGSAAPTAAPAARPPALAPMPGPSPVSPPVLAAALTGKVKAPAGLISNNSGNIISDNGGGIISDNGGGVVSNNGGTLHLLAVAAEVPVAGATVRLLDAAGKPVSGPDGKPLTATTAADGSYAFATLPADHNLVISTSLGQAGNLTALATRGGGKQVDVDLVSTLTTTYILDQYVSTQKDPVITLDKLPPDVEADTRTKADAAFTRGSTAVPDSLAPAKVTATVDSLRKQDATFDQQMETVKKLLIAAGQSDLGNGLPATEVDLTNTRNVLVASDGTLYIVTDRRIWRLAKDGTLVAVYDPPADAQTGVIQAALDGQDRLLLLESSPSTDPAADPLQVSRLGADGKRETIGTVPSMGTGGTTSAIGLLAGTADEVLVATTFTIPPQQLFLTKPQPDRLWSVAPGRAASVVRTLPSGDGAAHGNLTLLGPIGRWPDGTLVARTGMGVSTLAPGAAAFKLPYTTSPIDITGSTYVGQAAVDAVGDVFSLEGYPAVSKLYRPDGSVSTLASDLPSIWGPISMVFYGAMAPDGTVYLAGGPAIGFTYHCQIYHVANGVTTLVAGKAATTGGNANQLALHLPASVAALPGGGLVVLDDDNLIAVGADQQAKTLATLAGGGLAVASRVRTDAKGNAYSWLPFIFDGDQVTRVAPDGTQTKVGTFPPQNGQLSGPRLQDLAVEPDGSFAALEGLPGQGPSSLVLGLPDHGLTVALDPAPAVGAIATDPTGTLYLALPDHTERVAADGTRSKVADAGLAAGDRFAVDAKGRLYFSRATTTHLATIERYDAAVGKLVAIAGPGTPHFAGTGVDDSLDGVGDIAFASDGALLILDTGHKQVKRIPANEL